MFKLHKISRLTTYLFAASLFLPASAGAVIVGGGVTSSSDPGAVFQELTVPFVAPFAGANPPSSVGDDTFQSPNLFAFNEDQNILLTSTLAVDVGVPVAAGQMVASHYVFYDPKNTTDITGFVLFDAPIIGVATSLGNLNASDLLQNNLVTYLSPALRGLEPGQDTVAISIINDMRLEIDWRASTPGDYVRVFTQFSPGATVVPLPAALPLFAGGLGLMGYLSRRKKHVSTA